jgi:hypothetical protein
MTATDVNTTTCNTKAQSLSFSFTECRLVSKESSRRSLLNGMQRMTNTGLQDGSILSSQTSSMELLTKCSLRS